MDFIETNLEHPLPLERLAEVAFFSKYHFHRVFFAQVGETPGHTPRMVKSRFEQIAFNVSDMEAMADWYCTHMAMLKARHDPGRKLFLADQTKVVVFELYSNPAKPMIDLAATTSAAMHIAFVVDDMNAALKTLVAAGATVETPPADASGDTLTMLRDPFGLALQLVERKEALLDRD